MSTPATVQITGARKSYSGWHDAKLNLSEYLHVGDVVDEPLVRYAYEVVPPVALSGLLVQMGEPYDHGGRGGRARYSTFQKVGGTWFYTGHRVAGDIVILTKKSASEHTEKGP